MRRASPLLLLLLLGSLAALGCHATIPEGQLVCTTAATDCPAGWSCIGGACYSRPGAADAGAPDDARAPDDAGPPVDGGGVDAGVADAGSPDAGATPPGPAVAVAAGFSHSCAVLASGRAFCWGSNDHGEVGDGTTTMAGRTTAVEVLGLPMPVQTIDGGHGFTCAMARDVGVWCWGDGNSGRLGSAAMMVVSPRPLAVALPAGAQPRAIALGDAHACVLLADARVMCWGSNNRGQLGDGTGVDRSTPVPVMGLTGAIAIAAGYRHTCAIDTMHRLWCWGAQENGQLGVTVPMPRFGAESRTPVMVPLTGEVALVAASENSTCATAGTPATMQCWGSNNFGQLGDGTQMPASAAPITTTLVVPPAATVLRAGANHTCAVSSGLYCWGLDWWGQIGDGETPVLDVEPSPVLLTTPAVVTAVDGGDSHTCAIAGGIVYCWGIDASGQLGDAHMVPRSTTTDPVVGIPPP